MNDTPQLLVFSDLDGTLLHHGSYSWRPAIPALERLRAEGLGVILATSKTAAEVADLRAEIGFSDWPAIVENGGGLLAPGTQADPDAPEYEELRKALATLPKGFKGFGDMSADEITEICGLAPDAAAKSKLRQYSEPGVWTGDPDGLDEFLAAATDAGLFYQRGGRFITFSHGGTKADRMDELISWYGPDHTVALGDAPNDIAMIEHAEFGVIVANPGSPGIPHLAGEDSGRIRRTTLEGPEGWAHAILSLLDELANKKEQKNHG